MEERNEPVLEAIRRSHGYITDEQMPELAKVARLTPVLVRCGGGRFTAPAQDVEHLIAIIERDDQDYVRDVRLATR